MIRLFTRWSPLLLAVGVLLAGCTTPVSISPIAAPTTGDKTDSRATTLSPQEVVAQFYNAWLSYAGDPMQAKVYARSEYLTAEFIQQLSAKANAVSQHLDPLLCTQERPDSIEINKAVVAGDIASLVVHPLGNNKTQIDTTDVLVELRRVDGQWKIENVVCSAPNAPTRLPNETDVDGWEQAESWLGTLHTFPDGNQFGRYFERDDGQRFDIGAQDEAVQAQIASLLDSNTQVRLWGQYFPAVSAGDSQPVVGHIEVTRTEVVSATTAPSSPENHTPEMREIVLYWVGAGERLEAEYRSIPRTAAIGQATLKELLKGPQQPGLSTAIPTPEEVQNYPGREADWGDQVRLLGLTIEDGVATVNFSQEMRAYGGGSTRVMLIRQQITRTLQQFPTIQEVRIAIEGQSEGVLEP